MQSYFTHEQKCKGTTISIHIEQTISYAQQNMESNGKQWVDDNDKPNATGWQYKLNIMVNECKVCENETNHEWVE